MSFDISWVKIFFQKRNKYNIDLMLLYKDKL